MAKVHFYKADSEEGKIVTLRKGIFKDPVQDGLQFVFAKACKPEVKTGDRIVDNMLSSQKACTGDANLVFGWANVTVDENGEIPEDFQDDMIPHASDGSGAY